MNRPRLAKSPNENVGEARDGDDEMKRDGNDEMRGRVSKGIDMIKKSLIFAATLVAGFATAQVASAQTSPFNGFCAGGQVGYSYIDVEVSVDDFGAPRKMARLA